MVALGLTLVIVGAALVFPGVPNEQRAAVLTAAVGLTVLMARRDRRKG
jgi:hypothetical protein